MNVLVRHNAQGWHFTDPAVLEMRERKAEARRLGHVTRRQSAAPTTAAIRDHCQREGLLPGA